MNPILQNRYPIMVKCLNIGKNIGKMIYRSIAIQNFSILSIFCDLLLYIGPYDFHDADGIAESNNKNGIDCIA